MAMAYLRQRTGVETQRKRLLEQLQTTQLQISSVELNLMTTETVQGMQETRAALTSVRVEQAPERVADLADETTELMEESGEVAGALSVGAPLINEEALAKELQDMQSLMLPDVLPSFQQEPRESLPEPPKEEEKIPEAPLETQMLDWAETI